MCWIAVVQRIVYDSRGFPGGRMKTLLLLPLVCAAGAFPATSAGDPHATYAKDVAPILFRRCVECHRTGEAAPMPLVTYKEARPWAKAIRQSVLTKRMPPWLADPSVGHFANDRTLAPSDTETLVKWSDAGAPAGNQKDAPTPVEVTE